MTTPITEKIEAILRQHFIRENGSIEMASKEIASLIEKPAEKCNQELEIEHALYAYCVLPKGHAGIHDPNIPAPQEESSMGWEQVYRGKLEDVLDDFFPKIQKEGLAKRENKRGAALVLYAWAVTFAKDAVQSELARQREDIAGEIEKLIMKDAEEFADKMANAGLEEAAKIARNLTP